GRARTRRSPRRARGRTRACRSRPAEEDRADEGLRARPGVVGVDRDRHGAGIVRRLAVDLLEVIDDVAPLGDPLAELGAPRLDDDVVHGARLLALEDRAHGGGRVPDVPDDSRAHGLGKARPRDVDLPGLVVGRGLPRVGAGGQLDPLPLPLQDRRLLEVHLALDVERDRRAVALALQTQDLTTVPLFDDEVVLRAAPVAALPA